MRKTLISTIVAFFAGSALLAFWVKLEHRPAQAIATIARSREPSPASSARRRASEAISSSWGAASTPSATKVP
jgi:hypothetical protein